MLAIIPITLARISELRGNQALSANGSNTPSSFAGSQFDLSIQPFLSALLMNPFNALNCRASPKTKNVGNARIGASHFERDTGSSLSRIIFLMIMYEKNAINPPISGLATQDITTLRTTSQSINVVSCLTSKTRPTPIIPPIIE